MEGPERAHGRFDPQHSMLLGPYRAVELVGQGGMGRVFRAVHRSTGEEVAIKTVRTDDESRSSSIRREIHALSLVQHPGIVRILDQGVTAGVPWYAMELVRGPTLSVLLDQERRRGAHASSTVSRTITQTAPSPEDAGSGPSGQYATSLPIPASWSSARLLQSIRGLCAGLDYLHSHGIVHRDLKPENVVVRDSGMPVIIDFGITTRFGGARSREELIADSQVLGSYHYMAPEQLRGEHVDARADLYALGCILYECLTGRPPFIGSPAWVRQQHLEVAPEPPSRLAPDVAPALDALALALLAKAPRARLGYAQDVNVTLEHLGVPDLHASEEHQARPYLYRPELAGRDAPLAEMRAWLMRAVSGQRGGLVLIGGESGVGKTRLVMELARLATRHGAVVVSGQCPPLGTAQSGDQRMQAAPFYPLRPLLQAVADRCRELGASTTERLLGAHGRILEACEPSLAFLPYQREHPLPAELPAEQARARLLRALRATLIAFAAERPLMLVLDDLQWADELTLELVHGLDAGELTVPGSPARRLLVVGTYRMEEAGPELDAIARAEGVGHVELGRLDTASVRAIVGDMLALDEIPQRFAEVLAETSAGNPYFIAEYMQAAIGENLLGRDRNGSWRVQATGGQLEAAALPLPGSLAGLIERRISGLTPACQALLHAGAVLGRSFESELLTRVARLQDRVAMDAIDTLRRRQIFDENDAGQLRFVHDKLRETAYATISSPRRASLHRRAALIIERRHGADPAQSRSLAHHWAGAGVPHRAALCFLRAGDHARAAYANREATDLYGAAITHLTALVTALRAGARAGGPDNRLQPWYERLARGSESLGDVLAISGRQAEARGTYSDSVAYVEPARRVWLACLYRKIGTSWQTHHSHQNALAAYRAAEAALGTPPPDEGADWWQEWFQLQNDRIYAHYWLAQVDRMTELVERVRPVVQERGTPRQRAAFFDGLLHLWLRRQRYQLDEEALSAAHQALDAARSARDVACLANAHFMLGLALLFAGELGQLEGAGIHMMAALDLAERMGDITLLSRCATYATIIARRGGCIDDTRRLAERSLAVAYEARMLDYQGAARANLAWVDWRQGLMAPARAHSQAAIACWDGLAKSYPYGMQWPGRLLAIALDMDDGHTERAVEHARVLLEPAMVALPATLAGALTAAATAPDEGDQAGARAQLARAVLVAKEIGYL